MLNLILITADDLSYHSLGRSGCEFPEITPTIDNLSLQGLFFTNAHATIGLCQPSRAVMLTGMYPWNNGALGFEPINNNTTTLVEILKTFNYTSGIIGKKEHYKPDVKFPWDKSPNPDGKWRIWDNEIDKGRQPSIFYDWCKEFLTETKSPFFLSANSHHPHRNFPASTRYDYKKVKIPDFLPDTLEVRNDIAHYYEAVTRCDQIVESILLSLKESGHENNTLVVFTSDHGMAFPFFKANCYHFSSKIPLIFYCPIKIKPTLENSFFSSVDLMPTILNIMNLPCPIVDGTAWAKRKFVYTCLSETYNKSSHETRAIHNNEYCYINNFWSNGLSQFTEDGSLDCQPCVQSMQKIDPNTYNKLKFRTPEELYDIIADPFATKNIINDSNYNNVINKIKTKMKKMAIITKDKLAIKKLNSIIKLL
jgi:N-sulfoglucosamine sulfohydrolase